MKDLKKRIAYSKIKDYIFRIAGLLSTLVGLAQVDFGLADHPLSCSARLRRRVMPERERVQLGKGHGTTKPGRQLKTDGHNLTST